MFAASIEWKKKDKEKNLWKKYKTTCKTAEGVKAISFDSFRRLRSDFAVQRGKSFFYDSWGEVDFFLL